MTADRRWVQIIARWLARFDGVKGQVQMFSLAITAFSTFGIMLQGYGLGKFVPYIGICMVGLGSIYTYFYTEGGVWNQVQRDRQDLSNNFAGPNSRIQAELNARAILAGIKGETLTDDEQKAMKTEAKAVFDEYRDGIELDD